MKKKVVLIFLGLFLFVGIASVCQAQSILPGSDSCDNDPSTLACKQKTGDYQVNDLITLGINATNIMLGLVGSLALLAFVVGGVIMLISAGNKNMVEKGKGVIKAAIIGMLIVFFSYTIIRITYRALGLEWEGTQEAPEVYDKES